MKITDTSVQSDDEEDDHVIEIFLDSNLNADDGANPLNAVRGGTVTDEQYRMQIEKSYTQKIAVVSNNTGCYNINKQDLDTPRGVKFDTCNHNIASQSQDCLTIHELNGNHSDPLRVLTTATTTTHDVVASGSSASAHDQCAQRIVSTNGHGTPHTRDANQFMALLKAPLETATPKLSTAKRRDVGQQVDGCNNGDVEENSRLHSPTMNSSPSSKEGRSESTERRSARKNPKPIKNCGSGRMSENGVDSREKPLQRSRLKRPCNVMGSSFINLEETGRGKRAKKPVLNARFLENSSEDDVNVKNNREKSVSPKTGSRLIQSAERNKKFGIQSNSAKRKFGGNAGIASNGPSSREKILPSTVIGNRQSDGGSSKISKPLKRNGVVETPPPVSSPARQRVADRISRSTDSKLTNQRTKDSRRSIPAFISSKEIHNTNSARDNVVTPKKVPLLENIKTQDDVPNDDVPKNVVGNVGAFKDMTQQMSKIRSSKEGSRMELKVTTSSGEEDNITVVEIVDIDTSLEEDDNDYSKMEDINGEDDYLQDIVAISDDEHERSAVGLDSISVAGHDSVPVVARNSVPVMSVSKTDIPDSCLNQTSVIETSTAPNSKQTGAALVGRQNARAKCAASRKRKRNAADSDEEYNCNSKEVERLSKRYGGGVRAKPAKPMKNERGKKTRKKDIAEAHPGDVGPFVRVKGPRTNPSSCEVRRGKSTCDVDASSRQRIGGGLPLESSCHPPSLKLLDNVPWVCVLCGHGSTYRGLGDLFGPYYPSRLAPSSFRAVDIPSCDKQVSPNLGERLSPQKKSAKASQPTTTRGCSKRVLSPVKDYVLPPEMWVHMECALWTTGVYVAGGRLQGLQESAVIASKTVGSHS